MVQCEFCLNYNGNTCIEPQGVKHGAAHRESLRRNRLPSISGKGNRWYRWDGNVLDAFFRATGKISRDSMKAAHKLADNDPLPLRNSPFSPLLESAK